MSTTRKVMVERFSTVSHKPFEDVIAGLEKGISRPDMRELNKKWAEAPSWAVFEKAANDAAGPAGLMEFLRLNLGEMVRKDSTVKAYKMVRIITGNPAIMKRMAEHVPDAGSYAPVTILIYERPDGVHVSYDTMESFLCPYGSAEASAVAKDLDSKVINLINQAAA